MMSSSSVSPAPSSPDRTKINFSCGQHANNITKKLKSFFETEEFLDVTLVAGIDNVRLQAHRIVLSASSDFFLAMFRSSLLEAKAEDVELKEIDGRTLKLLLDFMYTGSIEIHSDVVETLLTAADFLQMKTLAVACSDFMIDQIDPSNCLGFAFFAEQGGHTLLHKTAFKYACTHFDKVCKEMEFLQLEEAHLIKFISCDDIYSHFEQSVLLSLVEWIEYDVENRWKCTLDLLFHVRFQYLKPDFISRNKHLLCRTVECHKFLLNWLQWHICPKFRVRFPIVKKRRPIPVLVFSGGCTTDNFELQSYDPDLNTWSYIQWPRPWDGRHLYTAYVWRKYLFIAGGKIMGRDTRTVEILSLKSLLWGDLRPLGTVREFPGIAALDGYLYVVGGYRNRVWVPCVERYDFATSLWQDVAPLVHAFECVKVAALNGRLYAVGNNQSTFMCYDPSSNEWTEKAPKTAESGYFNIVALGQYLYGVRADIHGSGTGTIDRYDPSTDTWTNVSNLGSVQTVVKCVSWNDRLITCGGRNEDAYTGFCEEYNPERDQWTSLAAPFGCFKNPFNLFVA